MTNPISNIFIDSVLVSVYFLRMKKLYLCPLILSIFILTHGCSHQKPPVLDKDKFVKVFASLEIINQSYRLQNDSTEQLKRTSIDSVFKTLGVNRDDFLLAVKQYQDNPSSWNEILQKTSLELEQRRAKKK